MTGFCQWKQNSDGPWVTDCDNIFEINDGTPTENSMCFCCYCGKILTEQKFAYTFGEESNND